MGSHQIVFEGCFNPYLTLTDIFLIVVNYLLHILLFRFMKYKFNFFSRIQKNCQESERENQSYVVKIVRKFSLQYISSTY